MLTKLTVRNFKRFGEVEIELGSPVVFIGPNNSGKTSAMQALALWDIGVKRWNEKRAGKSTPEKRPGVTVNRRDLVAIPVPDANLLWRGLHVRDVRRVAGRQTTSNIRIDLVVEGVTRDRAWTCGLEFDYANEESFYCRPLRLPARATSDRTQAPGEAGVSSSQNAHTGAAPDSGKRRIAAPVGGRSAAAIARMPIPDEAGAVRIAFLPPMSGLAATETRLDQGAVNVRIGEGRTAEVLRNLCFRIHEEAPERWPELVEPIERLFGSTLDPPRYVAERGEIAMTYRERGVRLDLSASGRGLQQTLLLLAYLQANPGAILLLDEPDAHLEILRQRQIYRLLTDAADASGSQIIAASHSEVLLNEAAGRHVAVAFVGEPHRIDDRGSQARKALRDIGFDQYHQAEQTGWVLYLEGATDLAILQAFARRLGHRRAEAALERPFVHYVGNRLPAVQHHYHGLREALPGLRGVALLDRLAREPRDIAPVECLLWKRREIENYVCSRATLEAYANASAPPDAPGPLFTAAEAVRRRRLMREAIDEIESAMQTLGRGSPWGPDTKVSDDFLTPLFETWFQRLDLPNLMAKTHFHELAEHVPEDEIDPEIGEKLDAIADVAESAKDTANRE